MGQYKKPVMYTVEVIPPGAYPRLVWQFPGDEFGGDRSYKLFKELIVVRGAVDPEHTGTGRGEEIITVNRIAWDGHPTREESVGLILDQWGWE